MLDNIEENLQQVINWATIPKWPDNNKKLEKNAEKTKKMQKKESEEKEKEWGNKIIDNKLFVYYLLWRMDKNPRPVKKKGHFKPDWETDENMIEVKTSNWWVDGTAGEKVYGTWIKYQDISKIYKKPLLIICVANQEEELTNGKTKFFGERSSKTTEALKLAEKWDIEYIPCSDLIKEVFPEFNK